MNRLPPQWQAMVIPFLNWRGDRMFSRRIVVHGLAALTAGLAWRPAWAVSGGNPTLVPVAVSSRMSALAEWWEEVGRAYDGTKPLLFTAMEARGEAIDANREDYKRWREAERVFLYMTVDVLSEPSRSQGDVIFKYHVIDMHHSWRPVGNWLWANAQDLKLCQQLEREAEQFGVPINPFWHKTPSAFAMIDGDRHSPKWVLISRWRVHGMPPSIFEAHEAAFVERGRMNMESGVAHRNS